jgi:hypothetical protein
MTLLARIMVDILANPAIANCGKFDLALLLDMDDVAEMSYTE